MTWASLPVPLGGLCCGFLNLASFLNVLVVCREWSKWRATWTVVAQSSHLHFCNSAHVRLISPPFVWPRASNETKCIWEKIGTCFNITQITFPASLFNQLSSELVKAQRALEGKRLLSLNIMEIPLVRAKTLEFLTAIGNHVRTVTIASLTGAESLHSILACFPVLDKVVLGRGYFPNTQHRALSSCRTIVCKASLGPEFFYSFRSDNLREIELRSLSTSDTLALLQNHPRLEKVTLYTDYIDKDTSAQIHKMQETCFILVTAQWDLRWIRGFTNIVGLTLQCLRESQVPVLESLTGLKSLGLWFGSEDGTLDMAGFTKLSQVRTLSLCLFTNVSLAWLLQWQSLQEVKITHLMSLDITRSVLVGVLDRLLIDRQREVVVEQGRLQRFVETWDDVLRARALR